jgi:hypothetical protein
MVLCCSIEREVLRDTCFDLFNWYREELLQIEYEVPISTSESYSMDEYSGSELDAESIGTHLSSLSGTDPSMPSLREVTNSSVGSSEASEHDPINDDLPSLKTCSDSSDSECDGFAYSGNVTFEEWLETWARAAEECDLPRTRIEQQRREHQLGDVLGNTVAALLDFFQPYPGDESIPWSDERRNAVRFRVLARTTRLKTLTATR